MASVRARVGKPGKGEAIALTRSIGGSLRGFTKIRLFMIPPMYVEVNPSKVLLDGYSSIWKSFPSICNY